MFVRWQSILKERLRYYTGEKTLAGRMADITYKSIHYLNKRPKDGYILDIGCGDGSQLKYLADRSNYIGIDRDLERLEILKKRYPEVTAIYCDATKLPFKSGSIKYIFSTNAFEHFWYLKEVILECYRCTYESGEMVIVFPTEGGLWNLGRRLFSKRHFRRKYPSIDFELISHIEHCNNATQIVRTLQTFFDTRIRYLPTGIPTVFLNAFLEVKCRHYRSKERRFHLSTDNL
jgi:ubiquinone/menaquinone biosynthesis C-methylase UbiE